MKLNKLCSNREKHYFHVWGLENYDYIYKVIMNVDSDYISGNYPNRPSLFCPSYEIR